MNDTTDNPDTTTTLNNSPSDFGVVVKRSTEDKMNLRIKSNTVIGIVGKVSGINNIELFKTPFDALKKANKDSELVHKILKTYELMGLSCTIIISPYTGNKVDNALNALRSSSAHFSKSPDIVIVDDSSNKLNEIQNVCASIRALAPITIDKDTASKDITVDYNRLIPCYGQAKISDSITIDVSSIVAGTIALNDSKHEYGFADSYSNTLLSTVKAVPTPVEFMAGSKCEADIYRKRGITTIINFRGFRLWGDSTMTPQDGSWRNVTTVRTFDKILEATFDGLFEAIDKRANRLKFAKDALEDFLRGLKSNNVLLGFDISWNENKNTNTTISEGKFFLDVYMQDMPTVKTLEVTFTKTDRYGQDLIKMIQ
jgi:hypothetical protein